MLYDAFHKNSSVQFKEFIASETLDKISLFRVSEELVRIIERDNYIKLTPLGALPKKVMVELYDKKFIFDYAIEKGITKLWKEQDCIAIQSAKIVLEIARIIKKTNGRMALTKKGSTLIKAENRQQFFELFISTFANHFNWGFNDLYPKKPIGQLGWTFTISLLGKYGQVSQPVGFYAQKYAEEFPGFLKEFETNELATCNQRFTDCFRVRCFERFLEWFGLVEMQKEGESYLDSKVKIKKTAILTKVFNIN